MNKYMFFIGIFGASTVAYSGVVIGDKTTNNGQFSVNGSMRLNYQDKHFTQPAADNKLQFTLAQLLLSYENPNYFANTDIRCYQYDTLCDLTVLTYAYAGYKINKTDNITLGLQPIPFGPARFWENSFYGSINNTMGLQDIHNLGIKYHLETETGTKMDLSFFPRDGGNYHGLSKDSARYTANFVKHDQEGKSSLEEKNMWIAKVSHNFDFNPFKLTAGGSYWYSDLENRDRDQDGNRQSWNVFGQLNYKKFGTSLTIGQLDIKNKDPLLPDDSVIGSFDFEYGLANKGTYYTGELNYAFKTFDEQLTIMPFFMYSGYLKEEKDFEDSERNIAGVMFGYKNIYLYTEYLFSKNDPFIGGSADALASGDHNEWNKMLNLTLIYTF
ncbi:hypothetical protein [Acinetobacter pseudolwoffii]|uniref:hypothetical protein n=1 Tax=Acinetobacter pseudolwoffii TaxID=2053287 RepID=UPI003989A49F